MPQKAETQMSIREWTVSPLLLREISLLKLEQLSGEAFQNKAEHLSYLESLIHAYFGIVPDHQFKRFASIHVKIILLQTLLIRSQGYSWSDTFLKLSVDMQSDEALEASSEFILTQDSLESYFCRYLCNALKTRFAQTVLKMRASGNTETLAEQTRNYLEALLKITNASSPQDFFTPEGLRKFSTGNSGFANLDVFVQALYERYIQRRQEFSESLSNRLFDTRKYVVPISKQFDVAQVRYLKKNARLRLRYLVYPTITTHNAGILIASALSKGYSVAEISDVLSKAGLAASRDDISSHISYVGTRHFRKLTEEQQISIARSGARTSLVSFLMKQLDLSVSDAASIAKRIDHKR